ncbi:MAG: sensor histidine kinase [Pseudomonadota bacterium]
MRRKQRFSTRARALAITRFVFLIVGAAVLAVPAWSRALGLSGWFPAAWLLVMIVYTALDFWQLRRLRLGQSFTMVTLSLDLVTVVLLVVSSGGLHSPAMGAQQLLTLFFALLFPRPLAVLPPLLSLPAAAVLGGSFNGQTPLTTEILALVWYTALTMIAFYVIIYLTRSQEGQEKEIVQLEQELKTIALLDERARLSREIHDGLGAALSGLIIQAEYLITLAKDRAMKDELAELKQAAEEAIDELRRSLSMMRDDFELVPSLRNTCETFRNRHRLPCQIEIMGPPPRLSSEQQLTIFRILQECLNNAAKHARAKRVTVRVRFFVDGLTLQVIDDGKGFDPRKVPSHHYGLINMRDRARKVGGDVVVETEAGRGTGVTFSLRGIGMEATREAAIPVRYTAKKKEARR